MKERLDMNRIHDMIIIGGGPAGYSAALYASRAGLDVVVLEKMQPGGQMAVTETIDNYPGFDEGIDGFTLGMKMQAGAQRFGAVTEYGEVVSVELEGGVKRILTTSGEFLSHTVVIATGADPRTLGLEGEDDLTGRGIHYCGHCDGRFYKGKTVVVVGGGNTAAEDTLYLSRLAKKVYLVHRRDTLKATKIYHEPLVKAENVEIITNSTVSGINFEQRVTGVTVKNFESGEDREIRADGVFVSIGRKPNTYLFEGQIDLDDGGYIIADETTKTSLEGVFAVGDVRTKALRQVVTAVSDGAIAVHFAEEYIATGK